MADLKITNVPQGSSVGTTDDIYIKTGSNFRRVPVSKLVELMGAQGFFQKGLDGIPTTDLYVEKVVIAPDDDSFVSSKTYSQISAAEEAGAEIQCEFQPGDGSYLRGMVLDITDSEALLAFLVPGPGPHISIFAVADLTVTETRIPISGQPCRAVCNTEEETTAKVAAVQGGASGLFSLYDGATVYVYFTNAVSPGSTLNVNNTGEKYFDLAGATEIPAGTYAQVFYQEALGNWILVSGNAGGSGSGLTEEIKQALLACFAHVAWPDDEEGQTYYDALEAALYPVDPPVSLSYITADYEQDRPIYDTDPLDAIKVSDDLTVTAHYSNGDDVVLDDDDYTLSGTLTVGTSTITVSYGGKTTTISVVVTSYWGTVWEFEDGNPTDHGFNVGVGTGASAGMGSSYYYLTSSSTNGASISGNPDFTGTSGVYEIEFMFPTLPNSSFYYGGPGVRFVFTGSKIQMYQTPYDSSLTDVYTGVQANTWYKARLEFAPNTIPKLTLNDTVIEPSFLCGWDGARFLMGISKNTGSVYIKSIKIREET